jgi:hypothetical protein
LVVHALKALAMKASAVALGKIGLRSPWSVKYCTEALAQTSAWPLTPGA